MASIAYWLYLVLDIILSGKGWYDYKKGSRKPLPSPEVAELIRSHRAEISRCPGVFFILHAT